MTGAAFRTNHRNRLRFRLLSGSLQWSLGLPGRRKSVLLYQGVHNVDDFGLLGYILEVVDQLLVYLQSLLLFFLVCHTTIVAEVL